MASEAEDGGNGFRERQSAEDAFLEHARRMTDFLRSHHAMLVIRVIPIRHAMVPYDVRHSLTETGGLACHIDRVDWPMLLPLREVAERRPPLN